MYIPQFWKAVVEVDDHQRNRTDQELDQEQFVFAVVDEIVNVVEL